MPEYPDIVVYVERLEALLSGEVLRKVRLASPFRLRSVDPPLAEAEGRAVLGIRRMGKRIVWELEDELFLVLHLMIAGRLRWKKAGANIPKKVGLAAFDFDGGAVMLTEAGSVKRASLHVVRGEAGLAAHDRGGLELFKAAAGQFADRLRSENHTVKRALTDPRLFSGIGNAYSDEILHQAGLSPYKWTSRLTDDEVARLFESAKEVLECFAGALRAEVGDGFPDKVTAFRPDMAVHGKFGKPCPRCGAPVQRIVYAGKEANYCARCQTGGKVLADRALSRLLKGDWPKTIEELEQGSPPPGDQSGRHARD